MKRLTGRKVYMMEGSSKRLKTEVECTNCGHLTYPRKRKEIDMALTSKCIKCENNWLRGNEEGLNNLRHGSKSQDHLNTMLTTQ